MDFETEKLLAKISGENVENFAGNFVSDADKSQIDYAFNQMFSGLSLLEWQPNVILSDAWKNALDKIREFIFSLQQDNYIIDYLRNAVYEHRKKTLKMVQSSVHANEYFQFPESKRQKLEIGAREKVHNGMEIIMNLVFGINNQNIQRQKVVQQEIQKEHERNREYERVRK